MTQVFTVIDLVGVGGGYVIVKNTPPVSPEVLGNFLSSENLEGGIRDDLEIVRDWVDKHERISCLIAENGGDRPLVAPDASLASTGGDISQCNQLIGTAIIFTRKRRPNWPPHTHFLAKRKN